MSFLRRRRPPVPLLRQFGDLSSGDFDSSPVWIACHSADYDEEWFDQTDEETFRPWLGPRPVDPEAGLFLVRSHAVLSDGATLRGFITPALEADDFATLQPHVFVGDHPVGFWGGLPGVAESTRSAFLTALDKPTADVFPITFTVDPALASGVLTARVSGWTRLDRP